jgi:hypothetical protein
MAASTAAAGQRILQQRLALRCHMPAAPAVHRVRQQHHTVSTLAHAYSSYVQAGKRKQLPLNRDAAHEQLDLPLVGLLTAVNFAMRCVCQLFICYEPANLNLYLQMLLRRLPRLHYSKLKTLT